MINKRSNYLLVQTALFLVSSMLVISCASEQRQNVDYYYKYLSMSQDISGRYYFLKKMQIECKRPITKTEEESHIKYKCQSIDFSEIDRIEKQYATNNKDILLFDVNVHSVGYTQYKDYGSGLGHHVPVNSVRVGGKLSISIYNKGLRSIEAAEFLVKITYQEGAFKDLKEVVFKFSQYIYLRPNNSMTVMSDTYSDMPVNIVKVEAIPSRVLYSN